MSNTFNQKYKELVSRDYDIDELVDIPTAVLVAASLGVLFMGVLQSTFIFILSSLWDHSWLWNELLKGLTVIGLSLIYSIVSAVYWWLIPRRLGVIEPRLFGFIFLLSLLASCFGVATGIFIILE